jgi:cysteine-rich repeat protein
MKTYRLATSQEYMRLVRIYSREGDLLDVEGLDDESTIHRKLKSICEEFVEEHEQAVIAVVKTGRPFSDTCFGPKSPCGASRTVCASGTYSLGGEGGLSPCWPCSRGTYQQQAGKTSCVACPQGSSSPIGSSMKSDCKPVCGEGEWSVTGVMPCQPCERGSFKPTAGTMACTPCLGGNGTLKAGATSITACRAVCGDSFLARSEGCDDGNTVSGDGCSSSCMVEQGYECSGGGMRGPAQKCRKVVRGCGDGKRQGDEE